MCGRLAVGKGFVDAMRLGLCGHLFDLLDRHAWAVLVVAK